jgi:outer membrane protein OmpA-like peptidoglycan-associated protein
MLQRSIGNQATQSSRSLTGTEPHGHNEQEADPASLTARGATLGLSWNFSKIPIFAPDWANRPQARSSLSAPPLVHSVLPGAGGSLDATTIFRPTSDSLKIKRQVADLDQNTASYFSSGTFAGTPIYPKASCACGGGCPACQSRSNDLKVSQPNDPAEIEADQIADKVMRMPADKPAGVNHLSSGDGFSSVKNAISSGGSPLDLETRSFFEPRFGMDFGHVRIHTCSTASQSARAIRAKAYTLGSNIVFRNGEYSPGSDSGRQLLAHELAHVAQSTNGSLRINRMTIYRQEEGDEEGAGASEAPMTRAEEITLSRTSPGLIAGEPSPLTLSLYNFGIDVSQPKAEHRAVLAELGRFLGAHATVRVSVRSIGFSDSSGPAEYNMGLSRRRANAVRGILDPLITQRISIAAYGETNPAASNDTVEGRNRNRRVDIRFYTDRPPGPVPPRPSPVPPGETPTPVPIPEPPVPVPPGPGPGGGGDDDTTFCEDHPILCGIGLVPFFAPLICLVAPEICVAVGCALLPELCIPPISPTPPERPPDKPRDDDDRQPMVIFTPNVRASNTPSGMNDRVGMRDSVSVTATVVNPPPAASPIRIFVSDNNLGAGNATINGQREISITGTTPLSVLGTVMSAGSYVFSPYIQLGAWWSGHLVGDSNRFAVSSIAQDWSVIDAGNNVGRFGYVSKADMDWVSDSGAYEHLAECRYVERVGLISESGGMTGLGIGGVNDPDDVMTCDFHPAFDEHGTPFQYTRDARREGTSRLKQLFTIRDMRSNSDWAPSRASGFEIHRTYERDPRNPHCWHLIVRKFGSAVTVGGWSAGAGSGDYTHEFRNIDCDPPRRVEPPPEGNPPLPQPDQPPPQPDEPRTQAPEPCCDRPEMARRVAMCIEDARQAAINCTLATLEPPYDPISNVQKMAQYYLCLDQLRADLLECDRRAKRDTNCPDQNTPPDCSGQNSAPGSGGGELIAQSSVERFIESISTTPLKPGDEAERIA